MVPVRSFLAATCIVLALSAVPFGGQEEQQPLFRGGIDLVDLYATVTDDRGRLVPDLLRDDFAIFDDGQPREIALFVNDVRPITVVVMLDTGIDATRVLDLIMAGAEQFLIRMLPDDRARIGAFNDKIEIAPAAFTGDRDRLIGELGRLDFGNEVRLYDALAAGLDALYGVDGRKIILVLTAGQDSASEIGWKDVAARAIADEVMVYAIGLETEYFNEFCNLRLRTRPDRKLRALAEETGGGYFELQETDEIGSTFTRVSQELHSQYVLGFTPAARDGKRHAVEVRVGQRGLSARVRRSYVAPREPGQSNQESRSIHSDEGIAGIAP